MFSWNYMLHVSIAINEFIVFLMKYIGCGHCKKLIPTWEQLAKDLENEPIVIAKIDATANDLDSKYGVRSFPTLLYFKVTYLLSVIYLSNK